MAFNNKSMTVLGAILLLAFTFQTVRAAQYTVGETNGWSLGYDFQKWATQYTFYVGDELYFPYPAGQHAVLLVTEDDYKSCNIQSPITSDNGSGDMAISLVSSEIYYFICGIPGHCEQGLKLSIEVKAPESQVGSPDLTPPPPVDVPPTSEPTPIVSPPVETPPVETPPVETPPVEAAPVVSTKSPPYYSASIAFHRNSAPSLCSMKHVLYGMVITLISTYASLMMM